MVGRMSIDRGTQLLDLGVLRLEHAIQRLRGLDREGALYDLNSALRHMQEASADPMQSQDLVAIIATVERRGAAA
jgi:hypothetical protein